MVKDEAQHFNTFSFIGLPPEAIREFFEEAEKLYALINLVSPENRLLSVNGTVLKSDGSPTKDNKPFKLVFGDNFFEVRSSDQRPGMYFDMIANLRYELSAELEKHLPDGVREQVHHVLNKAERLLTVLFEAQARNFSKSKNRPGAPLLSNGHNLAHFRISKGILIGQPWHFDRNAGCVVSVVDEDSEPTNVTQRERVNRDANIPEREIYRAEPNQATIMTNAKTYHRSASNVVDRSSLYMMFVPSAQRMAM